MRILDSLKISYEMQSYECDEFVDGITTADTLGLDHALVYKTLVTVAKSKAYYVFVIPIEAELDLKAAARAVNEKALELLQETDKRHIVIKMMAILFIFASR